MNEHTEPVTHAEAVTVGTRRRVSWRLALGVCLAAVCLTVTTACGSSSKPAYCTNRTDLENSIKGLTDLNVESGISGVQSQLTKIQSDANALVSSASSDFPGETSAIKSSVGKLSTTVKSLPASPSAAELGKVLTQAAGAVSSVQNFYDATKSKCS